MPRYKVPVYAMIQHEVRADIEVEADSIDHAIEEALSAAEYSYNDHDWNDTLGSFDVSPDMYVDKTDIETLDND